MRRIFWNFKLCFLLAAMFLGNLAPLPVSAGEHYYKYINERWQQMPDKLDSEADGQIELTMQEQEWLKSHPKLKLGVDPAWPPIEYFDREGEYKGIIADYRALIEQRLAISMEPQPALSWTQAVNQLTGGELDIIPGMAPTIERRKRFLFTDPYIDLPLVVVTRFDMPELQEMKALNGKILALPDGYLQEEIIRRDYPQVEILETATAADAIKAVASGRADAYLGDVFAANDTIKRQALNNLRVNFETNYRLKLAYAVRKEMPELVPILNKALASINGQARHRIEMQWLEIDLNKKPPEKSTIQLVNKEQISWFAPLVVTLMLLLLGIKRLQGEIWGYTFARRNLSYIVISAVVFILSIVWLVAWLALQRMEQDFRDGLGKNLENVNNAVEHSLDLWQESNKHNTRHFTNDRRLVPAIEALLALPRDGEKLINSDALQTVREIYQEHNREIGADGFFVIAPNGISLASSRDTNTGSQNLIAVQKPELLARVFAGESLFVPPIFSDIVQKDATGRSITKAPTMFFAEPVRDASGKVIAVCTLRFDPAKDFSKVIQAGRIGNTGDTYAFDQQARLLTNSRFAAHLASVTEYYQEDDKLLSFYIKDPGGNLHEGYMPKAAHADWPLTEMALSALSGGRGVNIKGYRDYRGVAVIGAWSWSSRLGIGLATEVNLSEALASYNAMRFLMIAALASISFISLLLTSITIWMSERARSRLTELVNDRTEELRKVVLAVEQNPLSVVITDSYGHIEHVNPAFTRITGYEADEVKGKHTRILKGGKTTPKEYLQMWNTILAGKNWQSEMHNRKKSGEYYWAATSIAPVSNDTGEITHFVAMTQDITEEKNIKQALACEREQLQSIIDSSPDGIFISIDGIIQIANPRFIELFGLQQGEHLAKGYAIPDERDGLLASLNKDGVIRGHEILANGADNEILNILLNLQCIEYQGQPAILGWATDITDLKRIHTQLSKAKEKADESTRAKSDFLANMSHEIRTPMNAIIGMSYLALQTELNDKQRNYVEKVNRSAESLLGIINDILDFSKIDADKLEIEKTPFCLEELFDNLASLLGLKAEEKGLELMFDLPATLPSALIGDPLRLTQVLTNLGNNALKFTEQGEVIIRACDIEQDGEKVKLHFSIRDTGVGLTAEQQQKLFHSFSQADSSTTRKYGGTGLGLVISKKLIELMEGEIWLESEPGVGSNFQFTICLEKQQGEPCMSHLSASDLAGERVLVVDDNQSSREITRSMLASFGLRIDQASSGQSALTLLEQANGDDPYKLLLMDWKMPGMDGIETIRAIHSNSKLTAPPTVIMVTAYGREEARYAATGLNISSFLTKPIMPSSLLDAVLITLGDEAVYKTGANSRQQTAETSEAVRKLHGAKILLVEDNEINQELVLALLTNNGLIVKVANNGREALDILNKEEFDGVLMDCQMPEMDGYEVTRKLRQQERLKDLPVLAMTANAMVGDREKVLAAGMNDHIAKPINVEEMFTIIARWIRPSNPIAEIEAAQLEERVDIPELDGIDTEEGLSRLQNNRGLYLKLLHKVRERLHHFIEAFDGAVAEDDWQQASMLAHTHKGLAGQIGAKALQEACRVVEVQAKEQQAGDAELEVLRSELQRIQESLSRLPEKSEQRAKAVQEPTPVDARKLDEVQQQLATLIAEYDTGATELLEANESLFIAAGLEVELNRIIQVLADYDFDAAMELVNEMVNTANN